MTDWIKYDGTNKPDDGALVRVRFVNHVQTDGHIEAQWWDWTYRDGPPPYQISHFQLNDKEND